MKNLSQIETALKFEELQPLVSTLTEDELILEIKNTFEIDLSNREDVEAMYIVHTTLITEHKKQLAHEAKKAELQGQIEVLQAQLNALEIKG